MKLKSLFLSLGLLFLGTSHAVLPQSIPAVPYYYVLDEPKALDRHTLQTLESLLVEHDRLTGEQFMVAIFEEIARGDIPEWTNRVFTKWKIGKRGQDNGALLMVSLKNHEAHLLAGYGLESILTSAKSNEILSDFVLKDLKRNHLRRALKKGVYQILETVESPLIQSGKAAQSLKTDESDLFSGDASYTSLSGAWIFLFSLGIFLLLAVLNELLAREAHFTGEGWFRPSPVLMLGNSLNRSVSSLISRKNSEQKQEKTQETPGGMSGNW